MMRSKFIFIIFILTFAGFVAVGCNQTKDEQAETTKQLEPGQTEDPNTEDPNNDTSVEVADGEITAAVKSKLMTDENVAARRIDVDTEDGVVTLRGTVASPTEADRAVELAKMADGVRLVHSYLKTDISDTNTSDDISELGEQAQDALNEAGGAIETGVEQAEDLGSDAAITAQIKWKLAKDKLVQAADIDVDTKDRHVTLTGIVSNQQEAKRALQIAQSVEDVLAVDNNLRIR